MVKVGYAKEIRASASYVRLVKTQIYLVKHVIAQTSGLNSWLIYSSFVSGKRKHMYIYIHTYLCTHTHTHIYIYIFVSTYYM